VPDTNSAKAFPLTKQSFRKINNCKRKTGSARKGQKIEEHPQQAIVMYYWTTLIQEQNAQINVD